MKFKPDRKQVTWGITIFLTLVVCVIFIYLIYNGKNFTAGFNKIMSSIAAILYGILIAFILNPVMNFIEHKMLAPVYRRKNIDVFARDQKRKRHQMRKISVALTIAFFVAILVTLIALVLPQLVQSIQTIFRNLPVYQQNVEDFFDNLAKQDPKNADQINNVVNTVENAITNFYNENIRDNMSDIIQQVTSRIYSIGRGIFNFIIGIIVSIYLLYTKDTMVGQGKKLAYAVFNEKWGNEVVGICRYINRTFIGFLTGKILDSIIIGILCFFATKIIGTPFPVLTSFIVGFTNIIPFFGPLIGAVIGGILVFMINPLDALWFIILCIILQTFDGYILGPKILGDSTGLSNFWVIFAIMFFGGLWGVVGWVIGVPLFAVFYAAMRRLINHWLRKRHKDGAINSEHMQDVAYYEDGEEREIGDPTATKFQANRPKTNSWAKALGIQPRQKQKKSHKE